jgi:integrase
MKETKETKKKPRQNQIVKLREKVLKSGEISLFLDIYYMGQRKYEFLPQFRLKPGKTAVEKNTNKELRIQAEILRARRQLEIINGEFGLIPDFKKNLPFLDYFKTQMEKRKEGESNYQNWVSTLRHLETFERGNIRLSLINEKWLEDWHSYLKNTRKVIMFNPAQSSVEVRGEDSKREYLTAEEVQKLIKTDCEDPQLKRAFLFSCLTGLRWSDIEKLTWEEVRNDVLVFKQQKTGGLEYQPISEQAKYFLGERKDDDERVFKLSYSAWNNVKLRDWIRSAGVKKKVSFHVARHTFATLSLTNGADLYTVGKLLGHKNIKTTQIYTKVTDAKKREAIDSLPKFEL